MAGATKLLTAGGGGVILTPASSIASDVTVQIPASNGTVITTASSGKVIPTAALPAGTVLQVVNATNSNQFTTTSGTLVDTYLTATITPTSATSKILALVNVQGSANASGTSSCLGVALKRNSSVVISIFNAAFYGGGNSRSTIGTCFLDSPATTSATVYTVQIKTAGGGNVGINQDSGSDTSSITLMEIAA